MIVLLNFVHFPRNMQIAGRLSRTPLAGRQGGPLAREERLREREDCRSEAGITVAVCALVIIIKIIKI